MKLSIRRWRARYSEILVGGLGLLCLIFILISLLGSEFSLNASSPWPWVILGLLVLSFLLYLRAISIVRILQEDIEVIGKRAKRIATGEPDSSTPLSVSIVEMADLNGAISAISRKAEADIAEMKRLEQVRSEFLGNVSHELRTPIFSVQGYLETLLDGAIDDPEVRDEFLEKAHNNMLRLHALLNDLIEISRIESGAMKMSFRYFDLLAHCRAIAGRLAATAEINNISIGMDVQGTDKEGKIMILGDKKRIEQALVNLIDNGIKYNAPGGEVIIGLAVEKDHVRVSVRDTGFGIPKEHLGRIFERFYRVDKGRSRDVGGSGLGLAIVKHIVEAHGSQITVDSTPGTGTTFSFLLSREE